MTNHDDVTLNCPKCGTANSDDAMFCSECGASLGVSGSARGPSTPASASGGGAVNLVKSVLNDAIALVVNPVGYMTRNKDRTTPLNSLMVNYVAILALVPFVGRVLGDLLFESKHLGFAIGGAIVAYFLDVIGVFVVGLVIWKLAPSFKTSTDQARATLLAAYLYTPIFLIGILNIVPVLGYLAVLAWLYGLYIMYRGLPMLLNTPSDETLTYLIVTAVVSIVVLVIISVVVTHLDVA